MNLIRSALLKASESVWLREQAPRLGFVRRGAERFLPGESVDDALAAARRLSGNGIATLLTHLGENVRDRTEAASITADYLDLLDRIRAAGLPSEISVKLTQLGLDLDRDFCYANLLKLIERWNALQSGAASAAKSLWIDMEQSTYLEATLDLYRRARQTYANTGVCVQAYLRRTAKDVEALIAMGASIRLVKGAYSEPSEIAFPKK